MSATAPAGSVKRKKRGADAADAVRESKNAEPPRLYINQVPVTSSAKTNVPDSSVANHNRQNSVFRSEYPVEAISFSSQPGRMHSITLPRILITLPGNVRFSRRSERSREYVIGQSNDRPSALAWAEGQFVGRELNIVVHTQAIEQRAVKRIPFA
jgi:hypothetical protein